MPTEKETSHRPTFNTDGVRDESETAPEEDVMTTRDSPNLVGHSGELAEGLTGLDSVGLAVTTLTTETPAFISSTSSPGDTIVNALSTSGGTSSSTVGTSDVMTSTSGGSVLSPMAPVFTLPIIPVGSGMPSYVPPPIEVTPPKTSILQTMAGLL